MKIKITILITILLAMFFCQTIFASFEDIEIMVKAAWGGDNETLIKYLSSGKVNVDDKNIFGSNALMAASETGNVELVRLLVEKYNANVNVKNNYGRTALMLADYSSHDIMEILLSHNADVNVRNLIGSTTLMLVAGCYDNYVKVIKLLISYGADVNAKDNEGKTAIDYAREASTPIVEGEKRPNKKEIIKILSDNMNKVETDSFLAPGDTPENISNDKKVSRTLIFGLVILAIAGLIYLIRLIFSGLFN